jgi:DivIVA domain-containing protein
MGSLAMVGRYRSTQEPYGAIIVTISAMSAGNEPPGRDPDDAATAPPIPLLGSNDVRGAVAEEIRDPSFSSAIRGYARDDVDRYVERVNRLIAELQISVSARAAVRHALERVGEQTSGILQRARETAEEITSSAREEADETIGRANAEAGEIAERARAEAEQAITAARAHASELEERANEEAESSLARARDDAEARVRQAQEEIASLRDEADSTMRSLRVEIEAIAEQRQARLDEVREIAMRLEQLLADVGPPTRSDAADQD